MDSSSDESVTPPPLAPYLFSDSVIPTMNLEEVYYFLKGKGIPDHYYKVMLYLKSIKEK